MSGLVFCPAYDTPGKHDATGAFILDASAFSDAHGFARPVRFDNTQPLALRKKRALERIVKEPRGSVATFALFSHGWKDGVQLGFRSADARDLATALKQCCATDLTVCLYCCDTGRDDDADSSDDKMPGLGGEGGFADALRNALTWAGFNASVYAHSSTGDTTRNPFVRVFRTGEIGGARFLIEPASELWCEWRKALQDTTLRLRYPFMTVEAIEKELRASERGVG